MFENILIDRCSINSIKLSLEPGSSKNDKDDIKNQKSKSYKDESKNLTPSECSYEAIIDISAALECCSGVGVDSDSHSNISCNN
jgi:hypothetical protein